MLPDQCVCCSVFTPQAWQNSEAITRVIIYVSPNNYFYKYVTLLTSYKLYNYFNDTWSDCLHSLVLLVLTFTMTYYNTYTVSTDPLFLRIHLGRRKFHWHLPQMCYFAEESTKRMFPQPQQTSSILIYPVYPHKIYHFLFSSCNYKNIIQ